MNIKIYTGVIILLCALVPLASAEEETLYINKEYGVEIKGPDGWYKTVYEYAPVKEMYEGVMGERFDIEKEVEQSFQRALENNPEIKLTKEQEEKIKKNTRREIERVVLVTFEKSGQADSMAVILLAVSNVSDMKDVTSALDFAKDMISLAQLLPSGIEVLKSPTMVNINGNEMVNYITHAYDDDIKEYVRNSICYFIKEVELYTLSCTITFPVEDEEMIKAFEEAFQKSVDSYKIRNP